MDKRIISFFWSNDEISWLRYMTLYSFRKYNPNWEIVLYKSTSTQTKKLWKSFESQDFFEYTGKNYSDLIKDLNITEKEFDIKKEIDGEITPNQESDFFRWKIMSSTGGFYSDMDILFVRSIEDLYDKSKEYDIGITFTNYYSIGLIFSNGDNKFFKDVYRECLNNFDKNSYQGAGVNVLKKWSTISDIEKKYSKVYNIPFNFLYQFNSNIIPKIYEQKTNYELNQENIGLHWYAGHPLSQHANNLINENNYVNIDSLIGRVLKKILEN